MACPLCRKETDPAVRPFCSKTCKNIDLNSWLSDRYTLKPEFFEKEIIQDFSPEKKDEGK